MGLYVDIEKKLRDITLKVAFEKSVEDGITGILGASGCGKSMTLKCIAGIVKPDRGKIVLNGRTLFDSEKKIDLKVQERNVGYLFQNYALFPNMTVRQNIEIVMKEKGKDSTGKAKEFLDMLHVGELADHYPARLSGGQQQRVALARILASGPDVLMLDEPFSALDYYLKEKLQLELLEVLRNYSGDILMVTHSRDEIYRFCETIHVIDQGRLLRSGKTKEVFREPQIVAAAKLTGCKNIAPFERVSDYMLRAAAWGDLVLKFEKKIPEWAEYIGIRAHYLRKPEDGEQDNRLRCRCCQMLDDPFEVTLILDYGIWWKIPKADWSAIYGCKAPEEIVLPEESILFLREE